MDTNVQAAPAAVAPAPSAAVPVGAKIISVLYYILSAFIIFAGIMLLGVFSLTSGGFVGLGIGFLSALGILGGILVLAVGILYFLTGRWLWHGYKKGRIIAIVLAALSIVSVVVDAVQGKGIGYFSLLFNLLVGGYLLFSGKVKAAFVK